MSSSNDIGSYGLSTPKPAGTHTDLYLKFMEDIVNRLVPFLTMMVRSI